MKLYLAAVIAGLILGSIASKYLFVGSWPSLIPWTIAGLVLGYFSRSYKQSAGVGAVYGFSLLFFFMFFGYSGHDPALSKVWFFALIGLAGAFYGAVVCLAAQLATARLIHNPHKKVA